MPMLKQLITDKRNLAKHLAAPFLQEREAYLESLNQKGLAKSTLQIRAIYLPHIIRLLKIDGSSNEYISLADIDAAAEKWSTSNQTGEPRTAPSTRKLFTQIAVEWLIYINRMDRRYIRTIIACGNLQFSGTIRKYYEYPFFEERLSYLEHIRTKGFKPCVVKEAAIYQLHAIDFLHLTTLRKVKHYEIETAAYTWSNTNTAAKNKVIGSILALNGFKWHTINWLKHLKLYEDPVEYIPWKDILVSYLDHITEELGGSDATRTIRHYMISKFLCYLESRGSSPQRLNLSLIDEYINELSKDGKRNRVTCANVATGIRSFVNYLEQMQCCPQGLSLGIRQPRQYKLKELPSSPEWNVVKDIVMSKDTDLPTDIRNHAILMLLSVYSLRCSEVINLKLKDLDWRAETVQFIRAKNSKPQVFPLKKEVGDAIIRYIRTVRPNQAGSDYVFLCMRAPYRKLSPGSIYNFVSIEFKNRSVELEHYGPHTIRKAGATHMINNGVSLKNISAHLGHQQLDTTRIYAKVDLVNLRKVADMDWKGVLT